MLSWVKAAIEERLTLMAPTRRLRLALVVDVLRRVAPADQAVLVLDAGSGDGLLTMAIARQRRAWSLTGWDLRADLLEGARQRAAGRGLRNVSFQQVDLMRALPEARFDVILAVECLTEIPDDRGTLERLSQRLAPGGWLLAHVPERTWRPVLPGSSPVWREEVRHGYSGEEISQLFAQLGLTEVEVIPTLQDTVTIAQEIRDRIKDAPLLARLLLFPGMVAAVALERAGLTRGPHRALLIRGRRAEEA